MIMLDSLELLENTFRSQTNKEQVQAHLVNLLESLLKDLENERNTVINLQQQILNLTTADTLNITSKFAILKDEYEALKSRLIDLKNENDDLNIQLIAKNQETGQFLAEKEEQVKNYYINELKQKDEEIKRKEKEAEMFRKKFEQKEQELYSEIQAAEVFSVAELNKVESDFKRQLNESNKKLKDSVDTCNTLRMELMSVKEQFNEYKRTSSEKIFELQKRLQQYNNSESESHSMVLEQEVQRNDLNTINNNSFISDKYQALDINLSNNHQTQQIDKPINLKKVPVYRSSYKYKGEKANNAQSTLPPLISLNNNNNKNMGNRKRKLFNPDDLTYLNHTDFDKDT